MHDVNCRKVMLNIVIKVPGPGGGYLTLNSHLTLIRFPAREGGYLTINSHLTLIRITACRAATLRHADRTTITVRRQLTAMPCSLSWYRGTLERVSVRNGVWRPDHFLMPDYVVRPEKVVKPAHTRAKSLSLYSTSGIVVNLR